MHRKLHINETQPIDSSNQRERKEERRSLPNSNAAYTAKRLIHPKVNSKKSSKPHLKKKEQTQKDILRPATHYTSSYKFKKSRHKFAETGRGNGAPALTKKKRCPCG